MERSEIYDDENMDDNQSDGLEGGDEGEFITKDCSERISLDKADRSLSELHRWYKTGRLILDPEWQRNYVWDKIRASKLIESFLLDIPVPVIYLAKNEQNKYEVIDGLQRLTAVFDFFDNKYKLQKLDIRKDLIGKSFKELSEVDQGKLEDVSLRSFELISSHNEMHFIVFERLNTGGIKLNEMEIRNCLYRGPLNALIKELANNSDFKTCINVKQINKRMLDRGLILRFLAFYERTHHKCQYGLKRFLNEFMETYRNAKVEKIEEYRRVFEKCMRASLTVFGKSAFRLKTEISRGQTSYGEWSSRPNAAIFQVIATSFAPYDLGQITRASDAIYESYVDLITSDDFWVDYVRRATGESSRLKYVFDTWHDRLKSVIRSYPSNDSKRIFSRQLKEEMFKINPNCHLCGQRIALLDDAALDHEKNYWMGGKTIPENARLVHRLCNMKKG